MLSRMAEAFFASSPFVMAGLVSLLLFAAAFAWIVARVIASAPAEHRAVAALALEDDEEIR